MKPTSFRHRLTAACSGPATLAADARRQAASAPGTMLVKSLLLVIAQFACPAVVSAAPPTDYQSSIQALPDGGTYNDPELHITFTMHHRQSGVSLPDGWYGVTSTGGRFRVALPGPAADFSQRAPTEDGAFATMHTVGLRTVEGIRFTATCTERSDHKLRSDYASSVVMGMLRDHPTGTKRSVQHGGLRVTRVSLRTADSRAEMEVFVLDGRAYQLIVEYPETEAADMPQLCERFFASFTTTGAA